MKWGVCSLGIVGLAGLLYGLLVVVEFYVSYYEGQRRRWYRPEGKEE